MSYLTHPEMKKNCDSCNSEGAVRATGFDADERVV